MKLLALTEARGRRWVRLGRGRSLWLSATVVLLALGIAGCAPLAGRIELSQTESDWGTVSNRASVNRTYEVRNAGAGPLEITGVSTSCGCTIAEISQRRLAPGEAAALRVTYDPLVHEGATGDFVRVVYVRSDDPDTPEAALTIRLRVTEQ